MSSNGELPVKTGKGKRLLIEGDSIALGVSEVHGLNVASRVSCSFVDIISLRFPDLEIHIDADVHRSTIGALRCIDELLAKYRPDATLLMVGGSDADPDWKRFVVSNGRVARSRVDLSRYTENLRSLIDKIRRANSIPILTDMPNQNVTRRGLLMSELSGKDVSALIRAHGGQKICDEGLELYRQTVAALAAEFDVPFAPYGHRLGIHDSDKVIGPDGIHPTEFAHSIIAEEVTGVLSRIFQTQVSRLSGSST